MKAREQPAAFRVGADEAGEARAPAERGDVVRGVAGPAADHLGRVVLQDEHRRLARDARDFAVDELVGDQIADDQHAAAREAVDERQQPFLALGLAGKGMNGAGNQHQMISDRQISDRPISALAESSSPRQRDCPRPRRPPHRPAAAFPPTAPLPVRTRIARAPTARGRAARRATCRRRRRIGTASRPRSAAARSIRPGAGFRQSHARAYGSTVPPG